MTDPLVGLVLVGAGGTVGAVARHLLSVLVPGTAWDTLAVNLLGSFALGAVVAASLANPVALALGTGFCGAFTTFSSFAVETVGLAEQGRVRVAAANALGTLALAVVAVLLGGVVATALA